MFSTERSLFQSNEYPIGQCQMSGSNYAHKHVHIITMGEKNKRSQERMQEWTRLLSESCAGHYLR